MTDIPLHPIREPRLGFGYGQEVEPPEGRTFSVRTFE